MQSGYPFDRDSDGDGLLRSQLDDIAKRHPEIAEHLENFASRDRQRHRSTNEEARSPRRPRQFSDRFERFGFPFDRDDFDSEYYNKDFYHPDQDFEQPHQHQSTYQQQQPQPEHTYDQSPSYSQTSSFASHQPTEPERGNLQQSSTFDLGKNQEPVDDRGQRSMSAPPSENTPNSQFHNQTENMSQANSETKSSNERIIPIHIEGRDEPVLPKNASSSFSSQQHAAPQPDRLFGKPTEHFTQFLPHDRDTRYGSNWSQGFPPEEHIRQQRFQPQYSAQKKPQPFVPPQSKGEIPIPVQREVPPKQQEHHQQHHPQQQHKPQHHQQEQNRSTSPEQPKVQLQQKPLGPLEQIQAIQKDVSSLMEQVETFSGKSKDKQYLYLDEMLTRNLIKLDNIDTQGQESIRSARKEAIKCIEKTIGILEAKAAADVIPQETPEESLTLPNELSVVAKEHPSKEMEVDEQEQEENVKIEPMETELNSSQVSVGVQEETRANESTVGYGQGNREVSEVSGGTQVNNIVEKIEDIQETKGKASDSKPAEKDEISAPKISEEEQLESTDDKDKTIIELKMKEESTPVPDSNVAENATGKMDDINKITEKIQTTVDKAEPNEEKVSGEPEDKKEKKGKKKIEKKEK